MRLTVIGAALLVVTHHALAADGYVFRHQAPEGTWDFDAASVVVLSDSIRRSQMSLTLAKPLQDQPTGSRYDRLVFVYEHDCSKNQMRVLETNAYLRGERVKMSRPSDEWRPAADSAAQKYACALVQK
jgi:hypothetical protein